MQGYTGGTAETLPEEGRGEGSGREADQEEKVSQLEDVRINVGVFIAIAMRRGIRLYLHMSFIAGIYLPMNTSLLQRKF